MDSRLQDILKALLANIDTLDDQLLSLLRCEQFQDNEECTYLAEHIRESCHSTLQTLHRLEQVFQSRAFIIPPDVAATLE